VTPSVYLHKQRNEESWKNLRIATNTFNYFNAEIYLRNLQKISSYLTVNNVFIAKKKAGYPV
jgi:hypothetical protein